MLVHSSSMAVQSCWILAGTGTRCLIRRSRASQTCSMGDISGEYAGLARTWMFSASRNCVQILATWGCALSCYNMKCHTCCLPSALCSENRDSSVKRTLLQSARRQRMWAFAHSSQLQWQTAVRSRPRWGRWACRWASLRRFLTVCAEILWLCKPIVAAAVRVAVWVLDVEVLGWCGYTWSAVVMPVGCTAKFSETPLEMAYVREMKIQFTGNSSGGHSCCQHANCTLPQNLWHLWHYAVW